MYYQFFLNHAYLEWHDKFFILEWHLKSEILPKKEEVKTAKTNERQ